MMRVVIARTAQREIDGIWWYWADRFSRRAVDGQVQRIRDGIRILRNQPLIGKPADTIEPGVRVLTAGRYQIYYLRLRGEISVTHVIAGERDRWSAIEGAGD